MRVVTGASSTSEARTQPVLPFGFSGNCTRYHCATHAAVDPLRQDREHGRDAVDAAGPNDASRRPSRARGMSARASCTTAA